MSFDDDVRDGKRPLDAVARVAQLARRLGPDRQAVLLLVAERLDVLTRGGRSNPTGEWSLEAIEEALDSLTAAAGLRSGR